MIRHIINAFKRAKKREVTEPQLQSHFPMKEFAGQFTVPKGWLILEMGQSPLHLLWFCHMVNGEDMGKNIPLRQVFVEEYDDPFDALMECNARIKNNAWFTTDESGKRILPER